MGEGRGGRPAWSPCPLGLCRQLSLDKVLIDFGSYVVGEAVSRVITLTNTGGLGTWFKVLPASEPCDLDSTPSVMRLVSGPAAVPRGGGDAPPGPSAGAGGRRAERPSRGPQSP